MARYGKIESGFWHSRKIRRLSQEAKFLMLYLLSSPHGNAIGCFVLHDGYISVDLGWPAEAVAHRVQELIDKELIERDGETSLLRIVGWWGHNSIENANVAKRVVKEIAALPACTVKERLIEALLRLSDLHPTVMQTLSEGLDKPFWNTSKKVNEPFAEPFRNQEPNLTLPSTTESTAPAGAGAPTAEIEKAKKRGSRIDPNWRPSNEDRQFARSLGFGGPELDQICAGFADYWLAKAGPNGVKLDWSATWRNWIRKEAQQMNRRPMRSAEAAPDSINWDQYVANYRASNGSRWPHRQLGPEPGYAGCRAPLSILHKYGLGQQDAASSTIEVSAERDHASMTADH